MNRNTLLLSVAAIIILASCSTNTTKEAQEKYQVVTPLITDTLITNEYVAEINAFQNVEVRSRIKGFIETILVDEGQTVRKGQTLFTISSKEYLQDVQKTKAALKSAMADLKSAEIELNNSQKLFDKKIIGLPEYDLAAAKVQAMKAKVEEAESDKAQAELNLSFAEVKAPFNGIINRIPNKTGSLVEEGTLLTTISNNKDVYAYFNVSEKDYLDYATTKGEGKSKDVSLLLANGRLYNHTGKIETTESEFDKSTGNIAFRAKFPNPENLLKHGGSGKVQVKTELKNVTLIPQKSTFEVQENIYVFVVDASNKVQQRKIVPSYRLPQLYVIASGLSPNDKIIYEGIQKVKDGDVVLPEPISFSQIANSKN
jgi:membrane fusion protein (multidrug efflux system)